MTDGKPIPIAQAVGGRLAQRARRRRLGGEHYFAMSLKNIYDGLSDLQKEKLLGEYMLKQKEAEWDGRRWIIPGHYRGSIDGYVLPRITFSESDRVKGMTAADVLDIKNIKNFTKSEVDPLIGKNPLKEVQEEAIRYGMDNEKAFIPGKIEWRSGSLSIWEDGTYKEKPYNIIKYSIYQLPGEEISYHKVYANFDQRGVLSLVSSQEITLEEFNSHIDLTIPLEPEQFWYTCNINTGGNFGLRYGAPNIQWPDPPRGRQYSFPAIPNNLESGFYDRYNEYGRYVKTTAEDAAKYAANYNYALATNNPRNNPYGHVTPIIGYQEEKYIDNDGKIKKLKIPMVFNTGGKKYVGIMPIYEAFGIRREEINSRLYYFKWVPDKNKILSSITRRK